MWIIATCTSRAGNSRHGKSPRHTKPGVERTPWKADKSKRWISPTCKSVPLSVAFKTPRRRHLQRFNTPLQRRILQVFAASGLFMEEFTFKSLVPTMFSAIPRIPSYFMSTGEPVVGKACDFDVLDASVLTTIDTAYLEELVRHFHYFPLLPLGGSFHNPLISARKEKLTM